MYLLQFSLAVDLIISEDMDDNYALKFAWLTLDEGFWGKTLDWKERLNYVLDKYEGLYETGTSHSNTDRNKR